MPSETEVVGFTVGLLTALIFVPAALFVLWPRSRRVRALPAASKSSFHRADGASWLEQQGFARLCSVRQGSRLSGHKPLEVFHHKQKGVFAFLGDGPQAHPSIRLMTRLADGFVVDTIASASLEGDPAIPEPTREQALERHHSDLAAATAAHGPVESQADSEIARQLAELAEWGPMTIPELRSRSVIGQLFLWPGLACVVLAVTSGWPLRSLSGYTTLGFKAVFALALTINLGFEAWFWRPWAKKVRVVASKVPLIRGSPDSRVLEGAGFVLLGHKLERSRRATPCDVYAHEGERAWGHVCIDATLGVFGYFLSTFENGASVITWTCDQPSADGRLTRRWAPGFAKAWELHRSTVSRLSDTHGALERCQTAEDREKATLSYYKAGGA